MKPTRVAFVGKGGVGKSVVAGAFARLLGRRGRRVLAVDSDPMPGLAFSLGLRGADAPLPDDELEEIEKGDGRSRLSLSALEATHRYAVPGADGVRFLQFGKLRGSVGPYIRSQQVFRHILAGMVDQDWDLVGDLPGGTRQPFFGWAGFADTVLVVTEPRASSLLTARRLAGLARTDPAPRHLVAVANKVHRDEDAMIVAEATGLEVVGSIPLDPRIAEADRRGEPPLDLDPDGPAMAAVRRLVDTVLARGY